LWYVAATVTPRFDLALRDDVVAFSGDLVTEDAAAIWRRLQEELGGGRRAVTIDLSGVSSIDGGVMALIVALRADLADRGAKVEIAEAPEHVEPLVALYGGRKEPERRKRRN
jgi:phospholipid/cholesterol/gamma-HCH transport system permease protein